MAIGPDNRWLVTGSDDGTTRLWLLQMNDLIDLARVTAGRNFLPWEWPLYFPGEPYHKTFPDLPGPDERVTQKSSGNWVSLIPFSMLLTENMTNIN